MCGIFGYVGQDQNAADLVLRGLKKLEYRGYDSWGVAVGHRDRVVVDKRIGKIGEAGPDLRASAIGIGHTRWATHGGVTEHNAHPHLDCAGRLALIHNGIVSNYRELREPLVRAGHRFRSETDTEVVAHLLEECLAATPAGPEQLVAATMGSAGHAALAAQYLLARIAGRRVTVATGSEFPYLVDFVAGGRAGDRAVPERRDDRRDRRHARGATAGGPHRGARERRGLDAVAARGSDGSAGGSRSPGRSSATRPSWTSRWPGSTSRARPRFRRP